MLSRAAFEGASHPQHRSRKSGPGRRSQDPFLVPDLQTIEDHHGGPQKPQLKANLASASGFVFLDPDGQPWTRTNFYKAWKRLLEEGGVPHYPFHACRHTCATRLLRRGNCITAVQKRLGHKYPSITLDYYSDALPDDQERLADDYDAVVAESALQNTLQAGGRNALQDATKIAKARKPQRLRAFLLGARDWTQTTGSKRF